MEFPEIFTIPDTIAYAIEFALATGKDIRDRSVSSYWPDAKVRI